MASSKGQADHLLVNAHILTMASDRPAAEALAISGDHLIAVGSDAEIRALAGSGTIVEDLAGATVLPGLIDAHNHLLATGQILQQVQL